MTDEAGTVADPDARSSRWGCRMPRTLSAGCATLLSPPRMRSVPSAPYGCRFSTSEGLLSAAAGAPRLPDPAWNPTIIRSV